MFGLFSKKRAPDGPVEFGAHVEIDCPSKDIYRLLDWADDRNAKRGEGHRVLPGDGAGQWRLTMTGMEDVTYRLSVTDEEPGRVYGYDCMPEPMVGRLVSSHELFRIESLAPDRCRVSLELKARFAPGLTDKRFTQEISMMSMACHNSLARLRIHAEQGADAARDAEIVAARCIRVEG